MRTGNPLFYMLLSALIGMMGMAMPALADTAVFTEPVSGDPGSVAGNADGAGVSVAPSQTVGLLFSTPFALFEADGFTPVNNNVTIFALSDFGSALATISFGRYNNGNPVFFHAQTFNAPATGADVEFGFLAFVGCGVAGGCDFIQISGLGGFGGSSGFILDAITFSDVALSSVTATTPEPGMWALMIIGFVLMARRLKHLRYHKGLRILPRAQSPQPSLCVA